MGTKHVIAYALHETERNAAERLLDNTQVTDSYVIGNTDEDSIEELQRAGLVVDEWRRPAGQRPRPWREAPCRLGGESMGGAQATTMRYRRRSRTPSQWLLSLTSRLMGEMREPIAATGTNLN